MKTFCLSLLIAMVGSLLFATIPVVAGDAAVGTVTIDQEILKQAITQVIKEDPKLIYDAYMTYQRQLSAIRAQQQFDHGFKNPISIPVRKENPVMGPENAPITIISFMDFQCPYCSRSLSTISRLMEMYSEKLRLVYKNTPLKNHAKAFDAAKAALAAHKQGNFWEFKELLFADLSKLNDKGYVKLAGELGLNVETFNLDRKSDAVAAVIMGDQQEAAKNSISSVPFFCYQRCVG